MCSPLRSDLFWLSATQQTEGFKKRWFTLDDRRLMYFKDLLVGAEPTLCKTDLMNQSWWCLCVPGCVRAGGGFHREQRKRLHRPPRPSPEHSGLPLAVWDHHCDPGSQVLVCVRDGTGPERLDHCLSGCYQQTHAASGLCRFVTQDYKFFIYVAPKNVWFWGFLAHFLCSGGIF